ncbi:Crotonase, core [Ophiocordyceps camponoti-floridani]|uniref:3-hydroxyisobutyryl-CoA hydrolase n=1 Tax=Ophiocordyceps camponoti-floridani TaxID=2030778 RepID=A0A8H4VB41_9HYPO|nr:Crotonase, core [Ophiocordyceps camponoti-floridani]
MFLRALTIRAGARVEIRYLLRVAKMPSFSSSGVRQLSSEAYSVRELPGDPPIDVVFESRFGLRTVLLNRPEKFNSLTGSMIRKIIPRLAHWEKSDIANVMIIKGSGDKAMCAGGDVYQLAMQNQESPDGWKKSADYFALEYKLDHYIATYTKPIVALMDGITMGGGVGLSIHAPFRIATERTVFAMPETAIGFFPDVGASFFLPRMNGSIGTYLALTGDRLKGVDVFYTGIATHYLHSTSLPDVEARLGELRFADGTSYYQRLQLINDTLEEFCTGLPYDQPMKLSGDLRRAVDGCFSGDTVGEIVAALRREAGPVTEESPALEKRPAVEESPKGADEGQEPTTGQEATGEEQAADAPIPEASRQETAREQTATQKWAQQQLQALQSRSPTSLQVTLRQMRLGGRWDLAQAFQNEHHIASKFMQHPDFNEGVMAVLAHKGKVPARWKPETVAEGEDVASPFFQFEETARLELFNEMTHREYPKANIGVPTEREVQALLKSRKLTSQQVEQLLVTSRGSRQGFAEVVREIITRKTRVDSEGKLVWKTGEDEDDKSSKL